ARDLAEGLLDPLGVGPPANGARRGTGGVGSGAGRIEGGAEGGRAVGRRRRASRGAGARATEEQERERKKRESPHRAYGIHFCHESQTHHTSLEEDSRPYQLRTERESAPMFGLPSGDALLALWTRRPGGGAKLAARIRLVKEVAVV